LRTGNSGSGKGFAVRKLNVDGLTVTVKTADASVDAQGAFALDLRAGLIDWVDLDSRSFEFRQIKGGGARLSLVRGGRGDLHIEKLSAGKLNARNIKARPFLSGRQVDLQDASFDLFEGIVSGSGRINLQKGLAYEASIKASGIDMALFIKDFDLKKKIELSGKAQGTLNVKGSLQGVESVFADIKTADPGGIFNITDESIIDGLAKRSGQAKDIIRSSFTDYHYESAQSRLTTEGRKVVLDTVFEGVTGKRTLKVVLHDFAIQGGVK
jgi:autotransporter translocation and assembly factor TamB